MSRSGSRGALAVLLPALLGGCAIGYNSMLFVTKSNIGIDVDTRPPTAEISIARREGVIAPTFEKGQKPPVLASFRSRIKGLIGIFSSVSATFAGGDAAATMTKLFDQADATEGESSALCLSQQPSSRALGREIAFPGPGEVRPFIFGTDTSLGLKVAWSGLTAQLPDTVKLGFNRKEFAWAPVFWRPGDQEQCGVGTYIVQAPSFLATIDSAATAKDPQQSGTEVLQYFATGVAATNLARRKVVRETMLKRLDPESARRIAKFKSFTEQQKVQEELVRKIQAAYDAADSGKKAAILNQARQSHLVPPNDTTESNFKNQLGHIVDGNKPVITDELNALLEFTRDPG